MRPRAQLEALLFLAPDPVPVEELADACGRRGGRGRARRWARWRGRARRPRVVLREVARRLGARLASGRRGGRPAAARAPAHAGADARAGRDAVDRRLPAAGLAARGGAHPRRRVGVGHRRAGRARADRGVRPLAVRRGALPDDAAVPQALRPASRSTTCPIPPSGTRARRSRRRCATACCARARSAPGPRPTRVARGGRRGAASCAAGGVDVAPAGEPHGRAQAVLLEDGLNAAIAPREEPVVGTSRSGCTG